MLSGDEPGSATFHNSQGLSNFARGAFSEARKNFQRAVNLDPKLVDALANLAATSLILDAPGLARHHAEAALRIEPMHQTANITYVRALIVLGETDLAAAVLDALPAGLVPTDVLELLRVTICAEAGDWETALFDLAALLEADPRATAAMELFNKYSRVFLRDADKGRRNELLDALGLQDQQSDERLSAATPKSVAPPEDSIDIVIPIYNARSDLEQCLASIEENQTRAIRHIILIDDASDEDTANWLTAYCQENQKARLFRNAGNLGFTRSVLRGIEKSTAPHFILLNSDTKVTNGWLAGMWRALKSRPMAACAGPLSNIAYYQSLDTGSASEKPGQGPQLASDIAPERAAQFLRDVAKPDYPCIPFLSGFCMLLDRKAYDLAGGLDAEAFPRGYGEVQDLALRLVDLGYCSVVADDVYVHHSTGRSFSEEERSKLIKTNMPLIYDRHSALRYLMAETMSRNDPVIRSLAKSYESYFKKIADAAPVSATAASAKLIPETPNSCLVHTALQDFAGCEACAFVIFAPDGTPADMTLGYLHSLRAEGLELAVCMIVDDIVAPVAPGLAGLCSVLMIRENGGYDFGAWADLLQAVPSLWNASRLYFANDSVIGPLGTLTPLISRIRKKDAGFFALTDCTIDRYHAQSYFFGWSGRNLESPVLRSFWADIDRNAGRKAAIENCEIPLLGLSRSLADPSTDILFPLTEVFSPEAMDWPMFSPTHVEWRKLVLAGLPFIKTAVLRDIPGEFDAMRDLLGPACEVARRAIETSHIHRRPPPAKAPPLPAPQIAKPLTRKRILIHTGFHKTGSSALQVFFEANAMHFQRIGIDYPRAGFSIQAFKGKTAGNAVEIMGQYGLLNVDLLENSEPEKLLSRSFYTRLDEICSSSPQDTVLISSEVLSVTPSAILSEWAATVSRHHDVEIIAFVRDPFDFFVSAWRQSVKVHHSKFPIDAYFERVLSGAAHASMLSHGAGLCALDIPFRVINYDHNRDRIIPAFMQAAGLERILPEMQDTSKLLVNRSLTPSETMLAIEASRTTNDTELTQDFVEAMLSRKHPPLSSFYSADLHRRILDSFSSTITALNQRLPKTEQLSVNIRDRRDIPLEITADDRAFWENFRKSR